MNPSDQITAYIDKLGDWRGKTLGRLRAVIRAASPDLVEEWKWSTPVWSSQGNVLAVGAFQDHVKLNFFKGASLDDPPDCSTPASTPRPPAPSISTRATASTRPRSGISSAPRSRSTARSAPEIQIKGAR